MEYVKRESIVSWSFFRYFYAGMLEMILKSLKISKWMGVIDGSFFSRMEPLQIVQFGVKMDPVFFGRIF